MERPRRNPRSTPRPLLAASLLGLLAACAAAPPPAVSLRPSEDMTTEDYETGYKAFLAKTKPAFKGR